MKKVLVIMGTRPEAIKLAPLIMQFRNLSDWETAVCVSAQHRVMLDQVLHFFDILPDYDLNIMRPNQSLSTITTECLKGIEGVIDSFLPELVIVQGDTTTALAGALAGYYRQVKVAHVEAGLRSGDKYAPFPEEMNRSLVGRIADYHFAPTNKAEKNLSSEGITKNVFVVGNTVIDALFQCLDIIAARGDDDIRKFFHFLDFSRKIILVTGHRRENFGRPFENICNALKDIALNNPDVDIIYPVHLNPSVRDPVSRLLGGTPNIHLLEPLDYPHLVWLLNKSYLVVTDSGGIQEEAPALGKPVLVMRDVTERTEGIEAGVAILVGTDRDRIVSETKRMLNDEDAYRTMSNKVNPYGAGDSAKRIVEILKCT